MIGLHIIADLLNIPEDNLKVSENEMKSFITTILRESDLNELGNYYHTFGEQNEITGVIALAESHISFHIWPEKKYISLDIFVCNIGEDNSFKAEKLYEKFIDFFKPLDIDLNKIKRQASKKL